MRQIILFLFIAIAILFSCQNKPKQPTGLESMPGFEQKFPQKSVWVHYDANDSIKISFSSMEEAEWKLMHVVPEWSYEDFEKIILSDPSSMDYPFDSLFCDDNTFCDVYRPVTSGDGNMRCFGVFPHSAHEMPMMLAYCRIDGKVRKAEDPGQSEDCYYCLSPDTIYTFNTGHSTLYFVWGYNGYTGSGNSYRVSAYELDSVGLHPAFVFEKEHPESDGLGNEQSLFTVVGECYKTDNDVDLKSLVYFDKKESAIYIREFRLRERLESGCSPYLTDNYWKYVWNGKKFVCK